MTEFDARLADYYALVTVTVFSAELHVRNAFLSLLLRILIVCNPPEGEQQFQTWRSLLLLTYWLSFNACLLQRLLQQDQTPVEMMTARRVSLIMVTDSK